MGWNQKPPRGWGALNVTAATASGCDFDREMQQDLSFQRCPFAEKEGEGESRRKVREVQIPPNLCQAWEQLPLSPWEPSFCSIEVG